MDSVIVNKIKAMEQSLIAKQTLYLAYNNDLQKKEKSLQELIYRNNINQQSSDLLKKFSGDLRDDVGQDIEAIVTSVLQKTLSDKYEFKIVYTQRRSVVEADFYLYNIEHDKYIDIMDSAGGTVADEVSSILFFVIAEMKAPGRKAIMFDEIGKFISPDKREEFFTFLKKLIGMYQKQVIYVTHQNELVDIADKVIQLTTGSDGYVEVK